MNSSINIEAFNCVFREISASVHEETRASDIAKVVVERTAKVLNAKGALVRTLNLETSELELAVAYGVSEGFLSKGPVLSAKALEGLRGDDVRIIADVTKDPRVQYPKEVWDEGIRMIVDAPLILQNRMVGLIRILFSEARELSEEERNFLLFTSRQGACAMENAGLIERIRTQYEDLALRTEKLSALGRMAAGIAHEINNPLTGILLYSSNLMKKVPEEGPIQEALDVIIREARRCKNIIQDLLEFSRDGEPNKVLAHMGEVIQKALDILENEFRLRHISVEKDLPTDMPRVLLDVNLMQQVFMNLLLNAVEAIEENGVITVRSHLIPQSKRLRIEIGDTGCGIPPEDMSRIFEPFFSTKRNGTGLGLAVNYGIIQKHRGNIQVSSQPGQGTLFTIEIPLAH